MKDLYSFHTDTGDLEKYYFRVLGAYKRIFKRCGLTPVVVEASGGTIGGGVTHEFMVLAESGEDKILVCQSCGWGANVEIFDTSKISTLSGAASNAAKSKGRRVPNCPKCKNNLKEFSSIEAAHTFNLGTSYSKKMGATFKTKEEKEKPIVMGCYGIGLGRIMATIVEVHHDDRGMIWPEEVAPFKAHLIPLGGNQKVKDVAEKFYSDGQKTNIEILYDDRDESIGVKFADADLIGIPWRVVVSERTLAKNSIEVKRRGEKKVRLVKISEFSKLLIKN